MKRPPSAAAVSTGTLTDGVIRLDDKVGAAADLKRIRNGGIVLTVEPAGEDAIRLAKMRRYYRGVVLVRLAAAAWSSPDNMHGLMAARYLGHTVTIVSIVTGEEFTATVYQSTTELPPDVFWEYIGKVRAFALSEYKLDIPDPDPAWRLHQSEVHA